jgi:hypothetical protein
MKLPTLVSVWAKDANSLTTASDQVRRRIGRDQFQLVTFDLVVVLGWVVASWNDRGSSKSVPILMGLCLVSAGTGGVLGFLFGLPRFLVGTGTEGQRPANGDKYEDALRMRRFTANSNLEQISDWLTKIIVGLGLINLGRTPKALSRFARFFQPTLSKHGAMLALMLAGANLLVGFLMLYSWTRIPFLHELETAERDLGDDYRGRELRSKEAASQRDKKIFDIGRPNMASTQNVARDFGVEASDNPDDPWKGAFGGNSVKGKYSLSAVVVEAETPDWFYITLTARSSDRSEFELTFLLHPTFGGRTSKVASKGGVVPLVLKGWGAFTVGAIIESVEATVELELDLAMLPGVPALFASK